MGLKERILELVASEPGLSDRQLADRLLGPDRPQQPVNIAARELVAARLLHRTPRSDGILGNYGTGAELPPPPAPVALTAAKTSDMSEDQVKAAISVWLERDGWDVDVRWGRERGIDIEAHRGKERWVIEAKGCGSRQPMRVNYFIGMLGETLQRMDDGDAQYSIALPDMKQYRGLWSRLPRLAKDRTTISMLFVAEDGSVDHII